MTIFKKNWTYLLGVATCAFALLSQPVSASHSKLDDYFQECPWLGLVAEEITYGPITISKVDLEDGSRFVIADPGESLHGKLKYKINTKDIDSLRFYHLVIGLNEQGAHDCVTHSLGVSNSKGRGKFHLVAPEKPGIYEVRVAFIKAMTCGEAREEWNSGRQAPSSSATIGVIIVN